MKKLIILGVTLAILLTVAGATFAANGNGRGTSTGQTMLDVSSPVTLSGTIADMSHYGTGEGPGKLIAPGRALLDSYLLLRIADGKDVRLMVGPSWFLQDINLALAVGDTLTVTGYFQTDGDLVVASLVKDGKAFTLRDQNGRPLWAGYSGQKQGLGTGQGTVTASGFAIRGNGDRSGMGQPAGTTQQPQDGTGYGYGRMTTGNRISCDETCPYCTSP